MILDHDVSDVVLICSIHINTLNIRVIFFETGTFNTLNIRIILLKLVIASTSSRLHIYV